MTGKYKTSAIVKPDRQNKGPAVVGTQPIHAGENFSGLYIGFFVDDQAKRTMGVMIAKQDHGSGEIRVRQNRIGDQKISFSIFVIHDDNPEKLGLQNKKFGRHTMILQIQRLQFFKIWRQLGLFPRF